MPRTSAAGVNSQRWMSFGCGTTVFGASGNGNSIGSGKSGTEYGLTIQVFPAKVYRSFWSSYSKRCSAPNTNWVLGTRGSSPLRLGEGGIPVETWPPSELIVYVLKKLDSCKQEGRLCLRSQHRVDIALICLKIGNIPVSAASTIEFSLSKPPRYPVFA